MSVYFVDRVVHYAVDLERDCCCATQEEESDEECKDGRRNDVVAFRSASDLFKIKIISMDLSSISVNDLHASACEHLGVAKEFQQLDVSVTGSARRKQLTIAGRRQRQSVAERSGVDFRPLTDARFREWLQACDGRCDVEVIVTDSRSRRQLQSLLLSDERSLVNVIHGVAQDCGYPLPRGICKVIALLLYGDDFAPIRVELDCIEERTTATRLSLALPLFSGADCLPDADSRPTLFWLPQFNRRLALGESLFEQFGAKLAPLLFSTESEGDVLGPFGFCKCHKKRGELFTLKVLECKRRSAAQKGSSKPLVSHMCPRAHQRSGFGAEMQIFAKRIDGLKTVALDVSEFELISSVKKKVCDGFGFAGNPEAFGLLLPRTVRGLGSRVVGSHSKGRSKQSISAMLCLKCCGVRHGDCLMQIRAPVFIEKTHEKKKDDSSEEYESPLISTVPVTDESFLEEDFVVESVVDISDRSLTQVTPPTQILPRMPTEFQRVEETDTEDDLREAAQRLVSGLETQGYSSDFIQGAVDAFVETQRSRRELERIADMDMTEELD